MKSVNFCFATHNHQPIGNFDNIIEEAFQHSYQPFFGVASKYDISFGTHFTGILLQWLEQHHPEYLVAIKQLVHKGQLEIISGGFYEPIISVIPPGDQQAQIQKLTAKVRELFGYEPHGMWLAERVWEQPLASVLHQAGIRYVILDDTHFISAGLRDNDLDGYYLTEDKSQPLAVFPISKELRYTMPFAPVDETIRVLKDAASESGDRIICFADDGEKFGVWPNTFETVYRQGWLEEFFRKLVENKNWIRSMHLSDAIKKIKPKGRIYLPNSSYAEMMQWALPTAETNLEYEQLAHELKDTEEGKHILPFLRGGYWRNFMVRYPEANHLHKRMMRTSEELKRAGLNQLSNPSYDKLLSAQCNDPYWHGVFGGIYLTNLRHANFSALIEADRTTFEAYGSKPSVVTEDYDCDGDEEVIARTQNLALYFKPALGGMIEEIDYMPRNFNAVNTIARRLEAYHAKVGKEQTAEGGAKSIHDLVASKETGLESLLKYDWHRHGCLIEHFLEDGIGVQHMQNLDYRDLGDFVLNPFHAQTNVSEQSIGLTFERKGNIWRSDKALPLTIRKTLEVGANTSDLKVTYVLTNDSKATIRLRFASEWTFNLLAGNAHDRYYKAAGIDPNNNTMVSIGEVNDLTRFELVDEWLKMRIGFDLKQPSSFWRYPIETVSLSESGFERVYQGSVVLLVNSVEIGPGSNWKNDFVVKFESI